MHLLSCDDTDEGFLTNDQRLHGNTLDGIITIVRAKASTRVEFGAKISLSKVGRFAFLDWLSWDAYNESADLKPVIESYRERYGHHLENVHVDAIYRTRENRQAYDAERDRIETKGVFGRAPG